MLPDRPEQSEHEGQDHEEEDAGADTEAVGTLALDAFPAAETFGAAPSKIISIKKNSISQL